MSQRPRSRRLTRVSARLDRLRSAIAGSQRAIFIGQKSAIQTQSCFASTVVQTSMQTAQTALRTPGKFRPASAKQ